MEGQVQALLASPPAEAVQRFFAKVSQSSPGLEVRLDAGEGKGKGVFATKDFASGDVLIHEPPLVAIQHTSNRPQALVCSHCFQYIGSVEEQVGLRLAWRRAQRMGEPDSEGASSDDGSEGSSGAPDDEQLIVALLTGGLQLPLTDQVPLPSMVLCPGNCADDKYCSEGCAQAAWQQYHSLLCVGEGPLLGHAHCAAEGKGKGKAAVEDAGGEVAVRRAQRVAALQEFNDHADDTNDVFLLAAKVVATVLLQARRLLAEGPAPPPPSQQSATAEAGEPSGASGSSTGSASGSSEAGTSSSAEACWAALQAGWEPFAMGHKAVWWESIALPEDVEDEEEFRDGVRQLAADSLELLTAAIFDPRFPALFDLRVWGSIIGMFELNNLDLFVPSPVARWRGLVEALPEGEQAAVLEEAGGLLEALDDLEEDGCEGNAFYSLQACVNHSCAPNAHAFKRDEDTDGAAVILALKDICAGEEVTISYVDEDASLAERQGQLADYGFACGCDKCCAEALAEELQLG